MPFSSLVFTTQGSWETTTLTNMGQQIDARAIYLKLKSANFAQNDGGGVKEGVIVEEARLLVPQPTMQDDIELYAQDGYFDKAYSLCMEQPLFPGSIEFYNGTHDFKVELNDPTLNALNFRFFMEGIEITDDICQVDFVIDSITNQVWGWYSIVTEKKLFGFSTSTQTIL